MRPRPTPFAVRLCVAAAIFALWSSPALCWEKDLHYALTKWLAIQAGFALADAETIARADQDWDDAYTRDAIKDVLVGLALDDQATLRQVQKGHFPSDPTRYPGAPQARPVKPGDVYARFLIDRVLNAPSNFALDIRMLGDGLHPFQDSWSHGGVSDTPPRPARPFIRTDWIWSHPETRHGWDRHDADLTAMFPSDATATAMETWKVLDSFARRSGLKPTGATLVSVGAEVDKFVKAADKPAKKAWIASRQPALMSPAAADALVDGLNVPGSILPRPVQIGLQVLAAGQEISDGVREAVRSRLQRFLADWFQRQDLDAAVGAIDLGRISEQFGGAPSAAETAARVRRLLMIGLIADHGAVNAVGHGNAGPSGGDLPTQPSTTGPFAVRPAPAQIVVPQQPVFPIVVEAIGFPNAFGVALRLTRLPHDTVVLVWRESSPGQWRIVRLLWDVS